MKKDGNSGGDRVNKKFWAINFVAFFIIIAYALDYFIAGGGSNPFWEASPFQIVFMAFAFYLITEGKMVQRVLLAKRLKEEDTAKEYAIIDKSIVKTDASILDKIKK